MVFLKSMFHRIKSLEERHPLPEDFIVAIEGRLGVALGHEIAALIFFTESKLGVRQDGAIGRFVVGKIIDGVIEIEFWSE